MLISYSQHFLASKQPLLEHSRTSFVLADVNLSASSIQRGNNFPRIGC